MDNYTKVIISFFACLSFFNAQAIDYNFYGFEMGLSHRNVLHINQDDAGFLWIGTINGLNRFDGYSFKKIDLNKANDNYDAQAVYEVNVDRNGDLILSLTNQLVRIDPFGKILQLVDFGPRNYKRGEERHIFDLTRKENGWWAVLKDASDSSYSLVELDNDLQIVYKWDLGLVNNVDILSIEGGFLYFIQNKDLLRCLNTKDHKLSIPVEDKIYASFKFSNGLAVISDRGIENINGDLIKRLPESLYPFLRESEELHVLSQDETRIVFSSDKSLLSVDLVDNTIENLTESINNNIGHEVVLNNVFFDQTGLLWISTNFGAISVHFDNHDFMNLMTGGDKLCSSDLCSMRGLSQDSMGNIYCSFYNSIAVIDKYTNKKVDLGIQIQDNPFGLKYYDNKLFTGSGLVIDLQVNSIISDLSLEGEGVLELYYSDSLFLFNNGDIYLWQDRVKGFEKIFNESGLVFTYAKFDSSSSQVYLGTKSNGVWLYDPVQNKLTESLQNKNNKIFAGRRVNALCFAGKDILLVGTDEGVFHFDKGVLLNLFDSKTAGFENSFINGILIEKNRYVWCSTDKGLVGVDLKIGQSFEINQSTIPFSEFNRISFFDLNDGTFLFGGLNGLIRFNPSLIRSKKKSEHKAKILISKVQKYNGRSDSLMIIDSELDMGDTLYVDYFDSFFQIDLSSSAYENPKKNRIRYKLIGYDKDWVEASDHPSARYNFVPAGVYTFRVEGESFGDTREISPLSLTIYVSQAFYRKPWFVGLSIGSLITLIVGAIQYRLRRMQKRAIVLEETVQHRTKELQKEKKKSEDLLLNILPQEIAEELKEHGVSRAKKHNEVTVLFTDFKGFTRIASKTEPEDLVSEIDHCFRAFDNIITRYKLEKIKTIGDAYLCVGGIENPDHSQAKEVVLAALEMQQFMDDRKLERKRQGKFFFEIRLGLHTGPIIAGIVGLKKFAFDIWGDTVNTASHIESSSQVGCVNISGATYDLIKSDFDCSYRGMIEMKNKDPMEMFFVNNIKQESNLLDIYKKEALTEDLN